MPNSTGPVPALPLALVSALALLLGPAVDAAVDERRVESSRELLRASGGDRQLASLGPAVERQFFAQAGRLPSDLDEEIRAVIRQAFDARSMRDYALAAMQRQADPDRAAQALRWLRGPLGRRVIASEAAASTPEAMARFEAFGQSLEANPPSRERLLLVGRLDEATQGSKRMAEMMSSVAESTARAALLADPERAEPAEIEAALAARRPALAQMAQDLVLVSNLFAFRDLPDPGLRSCVEFLESPTGSWYQSTTGDARSASIANSLEQFAIGVGQLFTTRP